MIKEPPSLGRLVAMVAFALSVFALLMFLWVAFGGPLPLKPKGYRVEIHFPEATTLAQEADVRIAGVNIGKVKRKSLDERGARTTVELEIQDRYAPIPRDTKAILRQKTLFGETYVELAPGHRSSGMLADGGTLPNRNVEPTVELDEIFNAFDRRTRTAFQQWVRELASAIHGGHDRRQDLNDAFGNLTGFSTDGARLLETLDDQQVAVHRLIRNTGEVFGAINQRQGALRQLVVNSGHTFEATASRDRALAETIRIFPTFLDESKATMARLERFSRNTHPLVNDLKRPADDLGPTIRDLRDLSPRLTALFRNLPPLIAASRRGLPGLARILRGAEPLLASAHVFFPELNPILSYLNFDQHTVAGFLNDAGANFAGTWGTGHHVQVQVAMNDGRSFEANPDKAPFWARGNAYQQPTTLQRAVALGVIEPFSCSHQTRPDGSRGEQVDPDDQANNHDPLTKDANKTLPCLESPASLYNGKRFVKLERGKAPNKPAPQFRDGSRPAVDPHPNDPRR